MFSIIKQWKERRVHLPTFDAWLKANAGASYRGNSADTALTLWFEEEPSEEVKTAIDAEWELLTIESEDAKFHLDADRDAAVAVAKSALLVADFGSLIPAERKLWMNLPLTDSDKDTILAKYPQA